MSEKVFHSRKIQWMLLDAKNIKKVTAIEPKEIIEWTYLSSVGEYGT